MSLPPEWLRVLRRGDVWAVELHGVWDLAAGATLDRLLVEAPPAPPDDARSLELGLGGLSSLDTVGALLVRRLYRQLAAAAGDRPVAVIGARPAHRALLDAVWRAAEATTAPAAVPRRWTDRVGGLGAATGALARSAIDLVGFFGQVSVTAARTLIDPRRLRLRPLVYHIEHVGLRALPILGLLAFLIGIVLGYQGAEQLRKVSAEFLVVDLLAVSILREMGILITAILVAGRSGSAFTAQIGTMKVNQEVDALRTIGLDPVELLVLPRILALVIVLPLLTFYANSVALFGGACMVWLQFDMTMIDFFVNLPGPPPDLLDASVGLLKAPVFAVVIGLVGCHEGLQVSGSAESVGLRTTRSVVEAIFLVMVMNALFSVVFTALGL